MCPPLPRLGRLWSREYLRLRYLFGGGGTLLWVLTVVSLLCWRRAGGPDVLEGTGLRTLRMLHRRWLEIPDKAWRARMAGLAGK